MTKSDTKKQSNKKRLIRALEESLGIVSVACQKAKVSRDTFYRYLNEDSAFKVEVESVEDLALDFVESKLYEQIASGSTPATLFYLRTKGKRRGYTDEESKNTGQIMFLGLPPSPFMNGEMKSLNAAN